jgi:hypothetical protein
MNIFKWFGELWLTDSRKATEEQERIAKEFRKITESELEKTKECRKRCGITDPAIEKMLCGDGFCSMDRFTKVN